MSEPSYRICLLDAALLRAAAWTRYRMFEELEPECDLRDRADAFCADCADWLRARLDSPSHVMLVAVGGEGGREVIGTAWLAIEDRPPHPDYQPNRAGFVTGVYVVPEYRRQGVARALMEELHVQARKRRVRKIDLTSSPEGLALYRSLGYGERVNALSLRL